MIIIYSSWSFSLTVTPIQVSGKQKWQTEWQNKHTTVEMETYLGSSSPPVFASAQAVRFIPFRNPSGNPISVLILAFFIFILTCGSQDWGGRQWFLKGDAFMAHLFSGDPCAVFLRTDMLSGLFGICIKNYRNTCKNGHFKLVSNSRKSMFS